MNRPGGGRTGLAPALRIALRLRAASRVAHGTSTRWPCRCAGQSWPLWQVVDEHGTDLDILLQTRCDKAAAKRSSWYWPAAGCAEENHHRAATLSFGRESGNPRTGEGEARVRQGQCVSSRTENSHQPTRERERRSGVFYYPSARGPSCCASDRSGNTSRSCCTCFTPRSIANSSPRELKHGSNSLAPPKIRPTLAD